MNRGIFFIVGTVLFKSFICRYNSDNALPCLIEPASIPSERCIISSAVGLNAAAFIAMTQTGRIFSADSDEFSSRPQRSATPKQLPKERWLVSAQYAVQRSVVRREKLRER
jgi:hypothetical protein